MAIGNVELMHECLSKLFSIGASRIKGDKDTEEEGKKRTVNMERLIQSTKKKSRWLHPPNYSSWIPSPGVASLRSSG